jgi:hypothetical protein
MADYGLLMSKADFYGFSNYGASFKSVPIYRTDLVRKDTMQPKYYLHNESGALVDSYDSETRAVESAEIMAKANPGRGFFVAKTITRSYVSPAPAITTRL